ncbi:MAG: hypothetical protein NVSMB32_11690 [Actinomycetota bacterium]
MARQLTGALSDPVVGLLLVAGGVQLAVADARLHATLLLVAGGVALGDFVVERRRRPGRCGDGSIVTPPSTVPLGRASRTPGTAAALAGALAGGVLLGTFRRYTLPVAIPVAALALAAVVWAWRATPRAWVGGQPQAVPRIPGAALWAAVIGALLGWELLAFALQPSIAERSAAHPTISSLIDPALAHHLGRSLWLSIWLAVGWLLVRPRRGT